MEDEMAINNWMPVYTRDILASCADMSPTQFGGYMRLLLWAWDSGGLPNDMEACCRIAGGLSPTDWQVVRKRLIVLDAGTSEERLSHPRLEREREKAQGLHQKRCEAMERARQSNPKNRQDQSSDQSIDQLLDQSIDQSSDQLIDTQPQPQPQPPIKNETPTGVSTSGSGNRRRSYRIHWDCEKGFTGISDEDTSRWSQAYPGVDLEAETRVAHAWLCDNPSKAGKRNWAAFLNRWFGRVQERGGTKQLAAPAKPVFRTDAGRALTATQYAEWKQARDRDEFLKAKARKRGGGLASLGDLIDGR
jgi:uncharacterized protein YdaU (DUF1376 family)